MLCRGLGWARLQATKLPVYYLKHSDGRVKPIQNPWNPMLLTSANRCSTWMFIPWQHGCGIGFDPYPHNIPRPVMLTWWTIPAAHTRIYVKSMAALEKQSSHEFKIVSATLWHRHFKINFCLEIFAWPASNLLRKCRKYWDEGGHFAIPNVADCSPTNHD
jgi:hypothetical protein